MKKHCPPFFFSWVYSLVDIKEIIAVSFIIEKCSICKWRQPRQSSKEEMTFQCNIAAAAKSLQSCLTLCDPIDGSPPGTPSPWDSPGKNTGVGCHFLLQCMKVKSESEVAQSCPTLSDPMDCSPPGSSVGAAKLFSKVWWKKSTENLSKRRVSTLTL